LRVDVGLLDGRPIECEREAAERPDAANAEDGYDPALVPGPAPVDDADD
jgi:hypothetical protein